MIVQKVQQFINQHNLFSINDKLLVGVSGGMDSVVLLQILHDLGYFCIAAHCNFHLRGEESERDALFVHNLADKLNIPFHKIDFQTEKYASTRKISIEMAARELRYQWFDNLKEKEQIDRIAIAHHKDDVVETFLINMSRGTGIHGLTGIKPKNGDIVRPLLCLSREEISNYVKKHNYSFVEDSTNKENVYLRNKFRNCIIPMMETINPAFKMSVLHTIRNMEESETFIKEKIDEIKKKVFLEKEKGIFYISIEKLKKELFSKYVLFEILRPYGFSVSVVEDIYKGLDSISGKQYYSKDYRILKDRELLILSQKGSKEIETYNIEKTDKNINIPLKVKISYQQNAPDFVISKDNRFCYLDADKLTFPLKIRKWEKGDLFVPFGMKHKKKVSDYFIDRRYSLLQKEQIWLLISDGKIVWIMGERSDNRFRIDSMTQKIMILEINK